MLRAAATLALLILVLAAPKSARSQTAASAVFNKYGGSPETWRPAEFSEPGVDAKGDLNLNLSILSIPGRGGLGYDVSFRYASGIRVDQPSSWIGGGWFFDPGSITRDVHGVVVGSTAHNVDFAAQPSYQPDQYQISLPGASASMIRAGTGNTFPPRPRNNSSGLALTSYRAWKIDAWASNQPPIYTGGNSLNPLTVDGVTSSVNGSGRNEYVRFMITDESGTRYVFEKPTMATYIGMDGSLSLPSIEHYASMWRLRSILGVDYLGPIIPTGNEDGSWVLLNYANVTTQGSLGQACEGIPTTPVQYAQAAYLEEILTPTHRATFVSSVRAQESFPSWQVGLHKRLDRIELKSRPEGLVGSETLIRKVELTQAASFASVDACGNTSRSALTKIKFTGMNGAQEPGYMFSYHAKPSGGGSAINRDQFGFYDTVGGYFGNLNINTSDGASWSLASIRYPAGGRDSVMYENDQIYQYDNENNTGAALSISFKKFTYPSSAGTGSYTLAATQTRQGGARVTKVDRYSAAGTVGPIATTTYTYGRGRMTGVPSSFWQYQFGGNAFYTPVDRGQVAVFYDYVQRTLPDGSSIKTTYSTPITAPTNASRVLDTFVWHTNDNRGMTIAQGNQDWAWGKTLKTEYLIAGSAALVRTVTTTPSFYWSRLNRGWNAAVPGGEIEWAYGDRTLQEVSQERDPSTGSTNTSTTTYQYHDVGGFGSPQTLGNALLRQIDVAREDGSIRRTRYTYAYEQMACGSPGCAQYAALEGANRLAEIAKEDVSSVSQSVQTFMSSNVTTYKSFTLPIGARSAARSSGGGGGAVVKPYQSFAWAASSPSSSNPPFVAWSTPATPTTAPAGWEYVSSNETYDVNGMPTSIKDARGGTTMISYNGRGQVTNVQAPTTGGITLARQYAYHPTFGLLQSVTDENGQTETYGYDDLARLQTITGPTGVQTLAVAYNNTQYPQSVTTTRSTGDVAPLPATNVAVAFYDGLGRPLQTQEKRSSGNDWVISAMEYFPGSASLPARVRAFRPYAAGSNGGYASTYASAAASAYGAGSKPYTDTEMTRDATGRTARVVHPFVGATAPTTLYSYKVGPYASGGPNYRFTDVTDEQGRVNRSFSDSWGNEFRTTEALGTSVAATTHTVFDALSRPTEIRPPKGPDASSPWASTFTYDTRGRVTQQSTPDAGTSRFAYDRAGTLRYSQDSDQAAASPARVSFTTYDLLGRALNSGVASTSTPFASLNGNTSQAWETDHQNVTSSNYFDQKPPAQASIPFEVFESQIDAVSLNYLKGQLVATSSISNGTRQLELSGFDQDGRLARRVAHTMRKGSLTLANLYSTDLTYAYDRQDRLTRRTALVGGAPVKRMEHWYKYDERGLNTQILTATTTTEPSIPDVTYAYNPAGGVASLQFRSPTVTQTAVPYTYDIRGRLTDIGGTAWSTANATGRPFVAHYDYSPAGDVTAGQFGHNTTAASAGTNGAQATYFRVVYASDQRSRLNSADYFEGGTTGSWAPTSAYDLSGISYDVQGNISTLQRRDKTGALVDNLTYNYQPNKNRLASLSDAAGNTPSTPWDAEAGTFSHDNRGNATALPAPYMASVTYDHRSRPLTVNGGSGSRLASYQYNTAGQRYWRYDITQLARGGQAQEPDKPEPAPAGAAQPIQRPILGARPVQENLSDARTAQSTPADTTSAAKPQDSQPTEGEARQPARSTSPWARQSEPRVADRGAVAPRLEERRQGDRPAAPPASGPPLAAAPASNQPQAPQQRDAAAMGFDSAVEFLVLDGIPSAGLQPVVGSIGLQYLTEEAQAAAVVDFNVLSPGGEILGRSGTGASRRFYHKDLLGSVRAVVTETGALAENVAYDPWGVLLVDRFSNPETATQEGFTGKHRLGGTADAGRYAGLDDFGARAYAPAFGRFMQVDPLADLMPAWGPYTYAFDNPLRFVDRDGRIPCSQSSDLFLRTQTGYCPDGVALVTATRLPSLRSALSQGATAIAPVAGVITQLDSPVPGPADIVAALVQVIGTGIIAHDIYTREPIPPPNIVLPPSVLPAAADPRTVREVLRDRQGRIRNAPLPPGTPNLDDVGDLTMDEISRRARTDHGFQVLKKLLTDSRFRR